MALEFVVLSGPDQGRRLVINQGNGMLGRSADAMYSLGDPRVSRIQCEVRSDGKSVRLIDNQSTGGTWVNGTKITEHLLKSGETIKVGESVLRFQDEGFAVEKTVAPGSVWAEEDQKAVEDLSLMVGRTLGHFEISRLLGAGENGTVFTANDTRDQKTVALKVMQPSFSKDEEEMQRFLRSIKTVLPLQHPNIIHTLAAGKTGPYCWIAMELVEGESLTSVIRRIGIAGMLDWRHAFRLTMQIGKALEYAHSKGIIHRNITPANIMIRAADKQAMLGDLMLAKSLEGTLARQVTRPGEVLGDVNYLSPERTMGDAAEIDHRSDLFSLGATAYALLTGKPPFAGANMVETITKIRMAEPVKPSAYQIGISGQFQGVVLKLLEKEPGQRYQSAADLIAELERIGRFSGISQH